MFSSIKLDAGVNGVENNLARSWPRASRGMSTTTPTTTAFSRTPRTRSRARRSHSPAPTTWATRSTSRPTRSPTARITSATSAPGRKLTEFQPAGYLDGATRSAPRRLDHERHVQRHRCPPASTVFRTTSARFSPPRQGQDPRHEVPRSHRKRSHARRHRLWRRHAIYIDYNNDGVKNSNEPSTITASDGSYGVRRSQRATTSSGRSSPTATSARSRSSPTGMS